MRATSKIAVIFLLAAGTRLSAQAEQNPAPCDDTALSQARALQQQRAANSAGRVLALYQEALRCSGSLPQETRGDIWLNIGRMQAMLDQMQDAYQSYSSALKAFQQISAPPPEIQKQEAAVLLNLAIALQSLGNIDEALPHFNDALQLFHTLDDKNGEAYTLGELGRTSFLMGDYEAALSYYDRTLAIRNSIDNNKRNNQLKAAVLDLIGRVHARMNQDGLAESYFQNALRLARETEYHQFIAYTLNDLGALQLRQNQPELAEQSHLEAENELEQYEAEDSNGIAETRALLADAEMALGKQGLAQKNYHAALSLQQQSGDVIGQAQTLYSLGLIESSVSGPEDQLGLLENAVELFHQVHHREGESQARFQAAKLLLSREDYENAIKQAAQAIQLAEEVRNFTPGRAQRTGYFASVEKMYRFEINLLLHGHGRAASQGDQLLAFDLMQRSQARALVDALEIRSSSGALADVIGAMEGGGSLLRKLKAQNNKLQWLLQSNAKPHLIEQTFNVVQRLESSIDQMEAQAEKKNPNLKVFSSQTSVSIPDVQQHILDDQSALIQFYLGEPSSYAWVITTTDFELVALPPRKELERDVRTVLEFGNDNSWTRRQQAALNDFRQRLAPLFALVQPKRWIVVPDGALHNFPFSLLSAPALAGAHGPGEIVKIPSVMAISASRQGRSVSPPYMLALFADPVFDRLDSRVHAENDRQHQSQAETADRGQSFSRLLYSRREMKRISRFVPQSKSRIFMDFAARASAASGQELKDFKIIHLATHSLIDTDHPELSRIVFSLVSSDGASATPGFLMLKDVYRMKLSSSLVVLSSCRGASGRQQPGEGPMSLSRAFLFAGSKAVVAPLWEVDDEATAELMGRFYQHMFLDHLPPISALRKAQNDFRHHHVARLRDPYYWAGFELYGDWTGR
jgi:CHAT domain-containing protein